MRPLLCIDARAFALGRLLASSQAWVVVFILIALATALAVARKVRILFRKLCNLMRKGRPRRRRELRCGHPRSDGLPHTRTTGS